MNYTLYGVSIHLQKLSFILVYFGNLSRFVFPQIETLWVIFLRFIFNSSVIGSCLCSPFYFQCGITKMQRFFGFAIIFIFINDIPVPRLLSSSPSSLSPFLQSGLSLLSFSLSSTPAPSQEEASGNSFPFLPFLASSTSSSSFASSAKMTDNDVERDDSSASLPTDVFDNNDRWLFCEWRTRKKEESQEEEEEEDGRSEGRKGEWIGVCRDGGGGGKRLEEEVNLLSN